MAHLLLTDAVGQAVDLLLWEDLFMLKLCFFILKFGLALALALFMFANRQSVYVGFDPFSVENPALQIGPLPLWQTLMAALFVGYLVGAYGMWLSSKGLRRKAAQRKKDLKNIRRTVEQGNMPTPKR